MVESVIRRAFTAKVIRAGRFCLSVFFVFGIVMSTQAAWRGWSANSTPAYWEDSSSWYVSGKGSLSGMYWNINTALRNYSQRTITFKSPDNGAGSGLRVDSAASDNPIIFQSMDGNPTYGIKSENWLEVSTYTAADAYLEIHSGLYKFQVIRIGHKSSNTGSVKIIGGTLESASDVALASSSGNAKGILDIQGGQLLAKGSIKLNLNANAAKSTVNITGSGVLTTEKVCLVNAGTEGASVTINGGILKAYKDGEDILPAFSDPTKFHVYAGAHGAKIDTSGYSISIGAAIENKTDETGCVFFTGGGRVALVGAAEYTGVTTIKAGTVLDVSHDNAAAILSHGLELVGVPALNTPITVLTSEEDLSDLDIKTITCPVASSFTTGFGEDGKSIIVTCTAYRPGYWTGAKDNNFNDGGNWADGNVPTGDVVIFIAEPTELALGEAISIKSITFLKMCATVAISGEGKIEGVESIINNSLKHHVFNVEVAFASGKDANITSTESSYMDFAGGVTMDSIKQVDNSFFKGKFTVSKSGDFTLNSPWTVLSGTEFNWPNVTWYSHNGRLSVKSGAKVLVKNAKISHNDSKTLLGDVNGVFEITGEYYLSGNDTHYMSKSGKGTYIIEKIRFDNYATPCISGRVILGEGGVCRQNTGYIRVYNKDGGGSTEFGAYKDWTVYHTSIDNTSSTACTIYKKENQGMTTVTFDTTDYYDSSIGRTITSAAPIGAADAGVAANFKVNIKGIGRFVFANTWNYSGSGNKVFAGGLTVTDSATVEVKANARPGMGAVTMKDTSMLKMHAGGEARTGDINIESGAALEVADSGTVTLGGNLTLSDGATLAFNYTDGECPVLALAENKSVSANGVVNVKITADNEVRAKSGENVLTTCGGFSGKTLILADGYPDWVGTLRVNGEGNIVVNVKGGFMLIVR